MAVRKRRRKDNNRTGKQCISVIVFAFVAAMSVQMIHTYQKNKEYIARQAELEAQLLEQQERQQELSEMENYTKTQEYIEDVARAKLGLAYDNEIIFKEQK